MLLLRFFLNYKRFKLTCIKITFDTPKGKQKVLTERKILRSLDLRKGLPYSADLCAATESPTPTDTLSPFARTYRFGSGTQFTNVPDVMGHSG